MSLVIAKIKRGGWIRRWHNHVIESVLSDCQW